MNFYTAYHEVAERLQDTSIAHKNRVKEWLNISQQEIASAGDWSWLETSATFLTITGIKSYTLQSNVDRLLSVQIDANYEDLDPVSPRAYDLMYLSNPTGTGRPSVYSIWSDDMLLWQVPDEVYTIAYKFYQTAADITSDGDSPLIPAKFHWVWLKGAEYYGLLFNDDERAPAIKSEFMRGIMQMRGKDTKFDSRLVLSPTHTGRSRPGPYYDPHRFTF